MHPQFAVGIAVLSISCISCISFTPLPPAEVDALTTCTNTDLNKLRKNLLLAGYGIANSGEEDFTTDFKQVSGSGGNRTLQRITVVKVADGTFRFRVRNRSFRVEDANSRTTVRQSDGTEIRRQTEVTSSVPVETVNDSDESYYTMFLDDYAATKREVCGE